MVQTTINIGLRRDRGKDGYLPIYLNFTQNRKTKRLSLGKKIHEKYWTGKEGKWIKERGSQAHPHGKAFNAFLANHKSKAEKIILERELRGQTINFEQFKLLLKRDGKIDWNDLHQDYMDRKQSKEIIEASTLKKYRSYKNNVLNYNPSISVYDIDFRWIRKYEQYMLEEKNCGVNTIYKNMLYIQGIVKEAIKQGSISENPFEDYAFKTKKEQKPALTIGEIDKLYKLYQSEFLVPKLQNVLKLFLFQSFTGIDYGDLTDLSFGDFREIDEQLCIYRKRCKKPHNLYVVPMTERAKVLVDWKENKSLKVFKVLSNQKYNEYIKEVAKIVGIRKHLTTHIGRHTFASILANSGVREKVIGKYLGQDTLSVTSDYVKYELVTLINEFKYETSK